MGNSKSTGKRQKRKTKLLEEPPEDLKRRDESLNSGLITKVKSPTFLPSRLKKNTKRKKVRRIQRKSWLKNKRKLEERKRLQRRKKNEDLKRKKSEKLDSIQSSILLISSKIFHSLTRMVKRDLIPQLKLSNLSSIKSLNTFL